MTVHFCVHDGRDEAMVNYNIHAGPYLGIVGMEITSNCAMKS